MSTLEFSHETMPTTEEFVQLLRSGDDSYDPIEELLSLERELAQLEQKYRMSSAEFAQKYEAGQMADSVEFLSWTGRYRLYKNLKQAISESLKLVAAD